MADKCCKRRSLEEGDHPEYLRPKKRRQYPGKHTKLVKKYWAKAQEYEKKTGLEPTIFYTGKIEGPFKFLSNLDESFPFAVPSQENFGQEVQVSAVEHLYQHRKISMYAKEVQKKTDRSQFGPYFPWSRIHGLLSDHPPSALDAKRLASSIVPKAWANTNWRDSGEGRRVMQHAMRLRYRSNPQALTKLLETGDRYLVEATFDRYWGCGLQYPRTSLQRRLAANPLQHPGSNWQGIATMQVRDLAWSSWARKVYPRDHPLYAEAERRAASAAARKDRARNPSKPKPGPSHQQDGEEPSSDEEEPREPLAELQSSVVPLGVARPTDHLPDAALLAIHGRIRVTPTRAASASANLPAGTGPFSPSTPIGPYPSTPPSGESPLVIHQRIANWGRTGVPREQLAQLHQNQTQAGRPSAARGLFGATPSRPRSR